MNETPREPPADDAWDDFVVRHPYGHFLQGAGWARLRARYGWSCERLLVPDGDGAAGAQMLVRRTRIGSVAYVARGPVCTPCSAAWPALVSAARKSARRRCIALRIEPNWPDSASIRDCLSTGGIVEAEPTQPRSTVRIRLQADEHALLAGMKQKWRYNVRVAERHGVLVRLGGSGDLAAFERLMDVTARRDGFPRRAEGYYGAAFHALGPSVARLYMAELHGELLGAIFVVHFGATATYLYGASADLHREAMPNHALQWAAIRAAKADGCAEYDLWGIPDDVGAAVAAGVSSDDVPIGNGGLWGVWRFKRGFGGDVWRAVGARDEVYRPARYWLVFRAAPIARRWLARLVR